MNSIKLRSPADIFMNFQNKWKILNNQQQKLKNSSIILTAGLYCLLFQFSRQAKVFFPVVDPGDFRGQA